MEERRFGAGEIIYREGDASDRVYVIVSGRVEIITEHRGTAVTLAILGPGDIFGEMGVIDGQPRSATVRVLDDVTVNAIDRAPFLGALKRHPEAAVPVMRVMMNRLRASNLRIARDEASALAGRAPALSAEPPLELRPQIQIWPYSEAVAGHMSPEGIALDRLPFSIGRRPLAGEPPDGGGGPVDLMFEDAEPFQLARRHFVIETVQGRAVVRDCSTAAGTIVNGRPIGLGQPARIEVLRAGENEVVAGNDHSPFRFRIVVEQIFGPDSGANGGAAPNEAPPGA